MIFYTYINFYQIDIVLNYIDQTYLVLHQKYTLKNIEYRIFVLLFIITLSIFAFTAHGHRYTPDEYLTFNQADTILSQKPDPAFISGQSKSTFQVVNASMSSRPICKDAILCSATPIGHAVSYIPFIFVERTFHIIPNVTWTTQDFNDQFYLGWRNSLTHEETFTYLFFGPIITALSVSILFTLVRTYDYGIKTSVILALLYGFSTMAWAYSDTGLNVVEGTMFILLAMLFYRKFIRGNNKINLIFCGLAAGSSALVRYDMAIFDIILISFLGYKIIKNNNRIANFLSLTIPVFLCGLLLIIINMIRFGLPLEFGYGSGEGFFAGHTTPLYLGIFGLLFSPGAGIFIFSPILLTMFISFPDFYKKHRFDFALILIYFASLLLFFGSFHAWHGFVGWSARYMLPIVPFLLIPLGSSIEYRKSRILKISIMTLGSLGAFFSFSWLVQDVGWFVWGLMGGNTGLFSLGNVGGYDLRLNPVVFWTFEYSQLTHALILMFTKLQVDLFLFKVLGPFISFVTLGIIVIPSSLFLINLLKNDSKVSS